MSRYIEVSECRTCEKSTRAQATFAEFTKGQFQWERLIAYCAIRAALPLASPTGARCPCCHQ